MRKIILRKVLPILLILIFSVSSFCDYQAEAAIDYGGTHDLSFRYSLLESEQGKGMPSITVNRPGKGVYTFTLMYEALMNAESVDFIDGITETSFAYQQEATVTSTESVMSIGKVIGLNVSDSRYGEGILKPSCPRRGERYTAYYMIDQGEDLVYAYDTVTITQTVKVFDDGTATIAFSPALTESSDFYAGYLYNGNGDCVGVLLNDSSAYVDWYDDKTFNAGSTTTPPPSSSPAGTGNPTPPSSQPETATPSTESTQNTDAGTSKSTDLPKRSEDKQSSQIKQVLPYVIILLCCAGAIAAFLKKRGGYAGGKSDAVFGTGHTEPIDQNGMIGKSIFHNQLRTEPIPQLWLSCRDGYMDGKRFPIKESILIGRDASADIRYPENITGVSRKHALLRYDNERLTLQDLSSSVTATYVKRDGRPVPMNKGEKLELKVGDVFYIGEQKNRFEVISDTKDGSPAYPPKVNQERKLFLSCCGGYQDGREFEIEHEIWIGRDRSCTVRYPENEKYRMIGRKHAGLVTEGNKLFLYGSSSNPTILQRDGTVLNNGNRAEVVAGDIFYIVDQSNRFEIKEK